MIFERAQGKLQGIEKQAISSDQCREEIAGMGRNAKRMLLFTKTKARTLRQEEKFYKGKFKAKQNLSGQTVYFAAGLDTISGKPVFVHFQCIADPALATV